jgi:hypothetical protein
MPDITLTNNTNLSIAASSADANATLNRYLTHPLTFVTPAGLDAIAETKVEALDANVFPFTVNLGAQGQFAVSGTSLQVGAGGSASVGLLKGGDLTDFFADNLEFTPDAQAGLISFGVTGTVSLGDTANAGSFTLGVTDSTSLTFTGYHAATATETLRDAVKTAIANLTIPHDLTDLAALPANAICQIDGMSSLQFTASVTYNILNDPLATASISNLPSLGINATAGATIEASATHKAEHIVTIAKMPNGLIRLSVNVKKTDDLETSLAASAGVAANVGSQDALAFLLGKISANSVAELDKIQAQLSPADSHQYSAGIKAAIDATLSKSLQASLKLALDKSRVSSRLFLYEIDLAAVDEVGRGAVQSALRGDFTAITRGALTGIQELDSVLTEISTTRHSLGVHLLGLFNAGSLHQFIAKSKVGFTRDTHEIVLSDERIRVIDNNLTAEKLRKVVVKGATFTLPASANTPDAKAPLNFLFMDRDADASPSTLRKFANTLHALGAPGAGEATALLDRNAHSYGLTSLVLSVNLNPQQCRDLYIDPVGRKPYDWTRYLSLACRAQAAILAGDEDSAARRQLFLEGLDFWKELKVGGAQPRHYELLDAAGIPRSSDVDVVTLLWWSEAMEAFAKALDRGGSLLGAAKDVLDDTTGGFDEPWPILATCALLQHPAVSSEFISALLPAPLVGIPWAQDRASGAVAGIVPR